MTVDFIPRPSDEVIKTFYASGNLRSVQYIRNGKQANGWSAKEFFDNGKLQLAKCFSHSLLIEQIRYDENGTVILHEIYSHSQKKLIKRPEVKQIIRPNIVSGCGHMGFYYKNLPAISNFINAEYDEDSLEKAYKTFNKEASDDEHFDFEKQYLWRLRGESMTFTIQFEKYEMLFFWYLSAQNEQQYAKAKHFMDNLLEEWQRELED